jgi:hypothetical protein
MNGVAEDAAPAATPIAMECGEEDSRRTRIDKYRMPREKPFRGHRNSRILPHIVAGFWRLNNMLSC